MSAPRITSSSCFLASRTSGGDDTLHRQRTIVRQSSVHAEPERNFEALLDSLACGVIEVDKAGSSFRPVKGRPASFGFTHRRTHCAVAILDQLTTDACTLHLCGQHPDRIEGLRLSL